MLRVGECPLNPHDPLDDRFGDKTEHAERQYEEQDKGTKTSRLRFLRQVPDDEQHVADQKRQAPCHADLGDLFFCHLEHESIPLHRVARDPASRPDRDRHATRRVPSPDREQRSRALG